jgi:hypothetical protein
VLEAAERAARSKSDIVATLSHEIRNGLTGVTHVLAAAAGKGGRAAPSREQLNAALDAAQDLVAVLNATLDSETAESGRLAVESVAFEPVRLIRDLVLLDRRTPLAKGLELASMSTRCCERANWARRSATPCAPARSSPTSSATPSNTPCAAGSRSGSSGARTRSPSRWPTPVPACPRGDGAGLPGLPAHRAHRRGRQWRGPGPVAVAPAGQADGRALEATSAVGVGSCFTLTLPFDEPPSARSSQQRRDVAPVTEAAGRRRATCGS